MEITTENNSSRTSEQVKPGYKKTPVGIIPKDWEVKRISKVGKIIGGGTPSTTNLDYWNGDINWFTPTEIKNKYIGKSARRITELGLKNSSARLLPIGTILLTTRATIGEASISTEISTTNQGFQSIVCDENTNNLFLYELVKFNKHELYRRANGSTFLEISGKEVKKIQLPIPPLPEQKAIADCLTTWDKGIEKLTQLIASKKEQKKGLMQQLLTGKKRLEGFEEEWKEVRLGKYFKERNQCGFDDLELLSIGEDGVYPQSESNKKDTSNADKSKYKLIEVGDLGYNTMRLWQGRIALSDIKGIVSPAYTIIIPQTEKVNSKYFSYMFKMPFVVNKFYRNSQGMVSDTLTCRYNDFKKIKLSIPSLKEQTAITEVLTTADKEIELLENKLETFKTQKKGLMQVLLTGTLRLCSGTNG